MPSAHRPAKRSLGQNFLVDANIQRKIVDALGLDGDEELLEIGPGRGALTRHLVGSVRLLHLVELDDRLVEALRASYGDRDDVHVLHDDVLDVDLEQLSEAPERLLVVGNIPYNITTPILFHLLTPPRPREIVLMVQDDVAARIVAPVGTKTYGALSVGVRAVAEVERLFDVGRGSFRPIPNVDSTIIRVRPTVPTPLTPVEEERLRTVVRAAFQWRRKQLGKILRDHPDLACGAEGAEAVAVATGLDLRDRPERLAPDDFVALSAALPEIGCSPNL